MQYFHRSFRVATTLNFWKYYSFFSALYSSLSFIARQKKNRKQEEKKTVQLSRVCLIIEMAFQFVDKIRLKY